MAGLACATPATIVIFGASGDLTQRKLGPALHSLACGELVPTQSRVVGVARSPLTDQEFRDRIYEGIVDYARIKPGNCDQWSESAERYTYISGDYDDPETYRRLTAYLKEIDSAPGSLGNRLFYLATPPMLYPVIIDQLGKAGLSQNHPGWSRIIVEKPFGHDLPSAQKLNRQIHAIFAEDQIYRIDHYLGKETVQNILAFRFANAIFEPVWNRNYIDHVQLTVAETVGVGHRAGYYDRAGVVRDMFQNHLLQLLTLTAMEPPAVFEANALRDEKVKVLRAIRPITAGVRAQYAGYCEEPGVADGSQTPTYAALELMVDNWRWRDVPFYLRSGKQLAAKTTEISIQFRHVPHLMFPTPKDRPIEPNILSLCLQPDEGIHLRFEAKEPGASMHTEPVNMGFHYETHCGASSLPDAYERLLLDALQGDAALFARSDEVELAWGLIDPIVAKWESADAPPMAAYEGGTWGPRESDRFLAESSRAWHHACGNHSNE